MDYQVNKLPSLNQPPTLTSHDILTPSQPITVENDPHVIEMNFGNQSKRTVLPNDPKPKKEEPKNFNYVYALLYENMKAEDAQKFVTDHLEPIAKSARVTHLPKENQLLLWVQDTESDKIKDLIQKILDEGKYVYVNDGSDVIFIPPALFIISSTNEPLPGLIIGSYHISI